MSDYTWPVTVSGEEHVISVDLDPKTGRATIRVDGRIPVKPMSVDETERVVPVGSTPYLVRKLENGTFDLDIAPPPEVFAGEEPVPVVQEVAKAKPKKGSSHAGLWVLAIIVLIVAGAVFGRSAWNAMQYMRVPWTPYSPSDASFKVNLPGVPREETATREVDGERWSMTTLSSQYKDHFYGVEYVDVKRVVTAAGAQQLLDEYLTRWAKLMNATVATQEPATLNGNPAIKFVLNIAPSSVASGVVAFRSKRVFFAWSVAPENQKTLPDLRSFVSSFELPPPPAATLKL